MLSKKTTWSHYVSSCAFAYSTSRHEFTKQKFTPLLMMFWHQPTLPIDNDIDLRKTTPKECLAIVNSSEPDLDTQEQKRIEILIQAADHIKEAQQKQKEAYDKKYANPERYLVNSIVLKKNFK